ncbi:Pup--protein ligase [Bifidobacterium sp. SMB2]|uniref:Pup--protein ligase n=1 Tax=Bifidobacterium saimiriisciurei TaxID=2661627 RepID=A0ABX0CB38_9BIFI|nr:Pup--protein ligase [Bifidobacterium saimiriisciurei]NEG95598.1 Pup--protein ligase [Bifidobacterium sp. SMB2]NEH11911.1 Pup--protein ligase [Bifidobacterium saimiriisciurei]
MPQLRDSRDTGAGRGHAGAEHAHDFTRIFGVETEYGVAVTESDKPVDPGQVAMTMFRPVVSRSRSTNTYLVNGSRLYLDVGSHPEYATAEAIRPMDALAQDLAGERVMRRLALQAQESLHEGYGQRARIHLFKNNVDSAGHSFGCHENYLLRRQVPLSAIEHELVPFLVTRQLFTGAGRFTADPTVEDGFEISQRAEFLDDAVSSSTTRSRPMVNTRDEPHADSDLFRRLHVIVGDSNRSQTATWMKMAVTHLVLCVIEEAWRRGAVSECASMTLADPSEAIRTVSRDRTGTAPVALADGTTASALAMQRRYYDIVSGFIDRHAGAMAVILPDYERAMALWRQALDAVESGDWRRLASWVDWAAKLQLIQAMKRRDPNLSDARIRQVDFDYHDIVNGTIFPRLERGGLIRTMVDETHIEQAVEQPPADTRAALRGRFVREALRTDAHWSCDWTHVSLISPVKLEAEMLDPFDPKPDDAYDAVLDTLRSL